MGKKGRYSHGEHGDRFWGSEGMLLEQAKQPKG